MPAAQTRKRTVKKAAPVKRTVAKVEDDLDDLDVVEDAASVEKFTIVFDVEKQTPGTYRYKERFAEGDLPVCGTLYLKRTAVSQLGEPAIITVTIQVGEE